MPIEEFLRRLRVAHVAAKNGDCLGCLLSNAGLYGGHIEGYKGRPWDSYYLTGNAAAHDYIRSRRWLRRVIEASIYALACEPVKTSHSGGT